MNKRSSVIFVCGYIRPFNDLGDEMAYKIAAMPLYAICYFVPLFVGQRLLYLPNWTIYAFVALSLLMGSLHIHFRIAVNAKAEAKHQHHFWLGILMMWTAILGPWLYSKVTQPEGLLLYMGSIPVFLGGVAAFSLGGRNILLPKSKRRAE